MSPSLVPTLYVAPDGVLYAAADPRVPAAPPTGLTPAQLLDLVEAFVPNAAWVPRLRLVWRTQIGRFAPALVRAVPPLQDGVWLAWPVPLADAAVREGGVTLPEG